jgi:hypothetical protein
LRRKLSAKAINVSRLTLRQERATTNLCSTSDNKTKQNLPNPTQAGDGLALGVSCPHGQTATITDSAAIAARPLRPGGVTSA